MRTPQSVKSDSFKKQKYTQYRIYNIYIVVYPYKIEKSILINYSKTSLLIQLI